MKQARLEAGLTKHEFRENFQENLTDNE